MDTPSDHAMLHNIVVTSGDDLEVPGRSRCQSGNIDIKVNKVMA